MIGPIGDPDSETRIHADWLLEEIINPVLRDIGGYEIVRADQISQPGMIDAQIIRYLIDSELVIADLSFLNPNAFYEIGVRHMMQKPIIHMQLVDDKIPFDVSLYRATKFSRARPSDLRNARDELKKVVASINSDGYEVENPVTRARGQIKLNEHATPEQRVLLYQLRGVESRLRAVENIVAHSAVGSVQDDCEDWYVHFEDKADHAETINIIQNALKNVGFVLDTRMTATGLMEIRVVHAPLNSGRVERCRTSGRSSKLCLECERSCKYHLIRAGQIGKGTGQL